MKAFVLFIVVCLTFFSLSCTKHIPTDIGGEPTPPKWVELSFNIDSIPAVNKTGKIQFQFIVTGISGRLPVAPNNIDSMNYIRISFLPDPGRTRYTELGGDTIWAGKVSYLDKISLNTCFTSSKTTFIYGTTIGGYRVFDWAVCIQIGYYHIDENGIIRNGFWGSLDPPFNNPTYGTLYINTKTFDWHLSIEAK